MVFFSISNNTYFVEYPIGTRNLNNFIQIIVPFIGVYDRLAESEDNEGNRNYINLNTVANALGKTPPHNPYKIKTFYWPYLFPVYWSVTTVQVANRTSLSLLTTFSRFKKEDNKKAFQYDAYCLIADCGRGVPSLSGGAILRGCLLQQGAAVTLSRMLSLAKMNNRSIFPMYACIEIVSVITNIYVQVKF